MKVTIYTDGAARGNPDGPGGYGTLLRFVDTKGTVHEREYSAGYKKTTNNRMELMAAIIGLEALTQPETAGQKYGSVEKALKGSRTASGGICLGKGACRSSRE